MIIVSPPVQTGSQEFGVWSLELGVWSWSWTGLRLDFRLTIPKISESRRLPKNILALL